MPAAVASVRALAQARAPELATALLAVALYLPTIGFGFVFDDASLIAPDGAPVAVGGALPYRPLRFVSYLLDSWLGGTPAVYHAHNVLLHALVAALVVALARHLGSTRVAALAGGVLVAVHPLAVEAAAYVAGRRDLLCAAFGLAAVLAHLSGRLVTALVLVVASTAAKESGLVFLAPLMAATIVGLDGRGSPRSPAAGECANAARTRATVSQQSARIAKESRQSAWIAMVSTALAGASALAMTLAYGAIGPWTPASGAVGVALPGRMAAHYLGALVGMRSLSPEYPQLLQFVDRVQGGDAASTLAASVATLVLAVAAAAALAACLAAGRRGRSRETAFVSAWTMAVLVALSLWGGLHEPGADRHAYLLLAPVGLVLATAVSRVLAIDWPNRFLSPAMLRGAAAAVVAMALLASASASRAQMQIWRSERALWTHASANASASPRAHANMARSLAADGRYREAARHLNSALAADPGNFLHHVGRAALRCAQARYFLARRDLKTARQLGAPAPMVADVTRDCGLAAT